MEMNYSQIKLNENDYGKYFPGEICSILKGKKNLFYGATKDSDEHICGVAAFTLSKDQQDTATLHYVVVEDKYRRQGTGSDLVNFAMDSLKAKGVSETVFDMISEDAGDLGLPLRFGSACGFVPVGEMEYLLTYSMKQLKNPKGTAAIQKNPEKYEAKIPALAGIREVMVKILKEPGKESVVLRIGGEETYRVAVSVLGEPVSEAYRLELKHA